MAPAAAGGKATSAPIMGHDDEPTMFELSSPGRRSASFRTTNVPEWPAEELVPAEHLRGEPAPVVELSERDLVAHFTRLTHRQYSVDLGAYPLGSCTMKYNPKLCDDAASLPGLTDVHPAAPAALTQGWLELLVSLEEILCEVTGMAAATLQPPAGAAGGGVSWGGHWQGGGPAAAAGGGGGGAPRPFADAGGPRGPGSQPRKDHPPQSPPRHQSRLCHPRRVRDRHHPVR